MPLNCGGTVGAYLDQALDSSLMVTSGYMSAWAAVEYVSGTTLECIVSLGSASETNTLCYIQADYASTTNPCRPAWNVRGNAGGIVNQQGLDGYISLHNDWFMFLEAVCDGTNVFLYVNRNLVGTDTVAKPTYGNPFGHFSVGNLRRNNANHGDFYKGHIAEAYVSRVVPTDAERDAWFNRGIPAQAGGARNYLESSDATCVLYYPLNGDLSDYGPNDYADLTMTSGSASYGKSDELYSPTITEIGDYGIHVVTSPSNGEVVRVRVPLGSLIAMTHTFPKGDSGTATYMYQGAEEDTNSQIISSCQAANIDNYTLVEDGIQLPRTTAADVKFGGLVAFRYTYASITGAPTNLAVYASPEAMRSSWNAYATPQDTIIQGHIASVVPTAHNNLVCLLYRGKVYYLSPTLLRDNDPYHTNPCITKLTDTTAVVAWNDVHNANNVYAVVIDFTDLDNIPAATQLRNSGDHTYGSLVRLSDTSALYVNRGGASVQTGTVSVLSNLDGTPSESAKVVTGYVRSYPVGWRTETDADGNPVYISTLGMREVSQWDQVGFYSTPNGTDFYSPAGDAGVGAGTDASPTFTSAECATLCTTTRGLALTDAQTTLQRHAACPGLYDASEATSGDRTVKAIIPFMEVPTADQSGGYATSTTLRFAKWDGTSLSILDFPDKTNTIISIRQDCLLWWDRSRPKLAHMVVGLRGNNRRSPGQVDTVDPIENYQDPGSTEFEHWIIRDPFTRFEPVFVSKWGVAGQYSAKDLLLVEGKENLITWTETVSMNHPIWGLGARRYRQLTVPRALRRL